MARKRKTAAELIAELESNPEHVKMRQRQDEELHHRRLFRERAEQPLVRDLREVGCDVESVWDLVGSWGPYPEAIDVLVSHLDGEYPAKIREGIARALAVPVLDQEHWEILLSHFVKEEDVEAKWALALALAKNAKMENGERLVELITDPGNGKGRSVLADALYQFRTEEVTEVLRSLTTDPEIGTSIGRLLKTGSTFVS